MREPPLPPPPPPRPEHAPWRAPAEGGATQAGVPPHDPSRPSGPGTPWRAARARRPMRVWDLVLTIVLLIGAFCLTLLLSYFGLFVAMASDACMGENDCSGDLIGWGVLVAAGGVWLPFLAALIASVMLLVMRRIAFWVPVVGLVLSFGLTLLGAWMAMVGSGS